MNRKYSGIRRRFSEEVRQSIVRSIDRGEVRPSAAARECGASLSTIYEWLARYSIHYKRSTRIVVEKYSMENKLKSLREEIAKLESSVGRKQLQIEYLEKVIELASLELGVDIKKKFEGPPSSGSGPITTRKSGR
ncbi:MAG TPA: transposase [Flavobacteriales bacterium]|jgi:transposase-like protein|nr:transposase [Flavobacteriales bacterium]